MEIKPTFYAISKQDKTTSPELERFLADRMKAKTIEVDASHVSLISKPKEIADFIFWPQERVHSGTKRNGLER